jgi:hypothetical protein
MCVSGFQRVAFSLLSAFLLPPLSPLSLVLQAMANSSILFQVSGGWKDSNSLSFLEP